MSKPMQIEGRVWVITDAEGKLIDNIDTDMIFHNAHLAITDIAKMGPLSFGNLKGWQDFPSKVQAGDIVVVGENFGSGSSRQQAVDCFAALGVAAIVGRSFGAIWLRNAVNSGFPILRHRAIMSPDAPIATGEILQLDFETGQVINATQGCELTPADPFFGVQRDIYQAGSLFAYGRTL